MSLLRNTDVKKHLARAVPRSFSPATENVHKTNEDVAISSINQTEPTAEEFIHVAPKAESPTTAVSALHE